MKSNIFAIIAFFIVFGVTAQTGAKLSLKSALALPQDSHLGWAVSVDGEYAVASAPHEKVDSVISSGAVYIYKLTEGEWNLFQRIIPSDPSMMKLFGSSVKLNGTTLLIGAPNDNVKQGAVYVFNLKNSTWQQTQKITPQNPVSFEMFGTAVDLNDGLALISSVSSQTNLLSSGSVYLFKALSGELSESGIIVSPESNVHNLFGASLAVVSRTQIIVAAPMGGQSKQNYGVVYYFKKTDLGWKLEQQIDSPEPQEKGLFGSALSYSSNRVLIGAMQEDADSIKSGAAYIFSFDYLEKWNLDKRLVPEEPGNHDYFGMALVLNDSVAVVGLPKWEENNKTRDMGAADIFRFNRESWEFSEKIIPDEGEKDDHFALSVAADDNFVLIGSRLDNNLMRNQGSAHFYAINDLFTNVIENEIQENNGMFNINPNPFINETEISILIRDEAVVKLEIFDINGKLLVGLMYGLQSPGTKKVIWNRRDSNGNKVVAGPYICNFEVGRNRISKQLVVY